MNSNVLTIPQFEKDVKHLSKKFKSLKKDLLKLIKSLEEEPTQGTSLGQGLYKIRLANSSIPTGKRGGFRIISYFIDEENISDDELRDVLKFFCQ